MNLKTKPPAVGICCASALACLLATSSALAQSGPDASERADYAGQPPTQLEAVTIAGDKLGREVSESATSVGVATEEDLEGAPADKMQEVVSKYGNVVRFGSDREIAIRGIPQNGIAGEGETISVYLDGVALPQRAASFTGPLSTFDMRQVEVLRGPQSTAQGRNSLAGSVYLRSNDPTPEWDARARVAGWSNSSHQYAVAGGGPLIGDQLMFRVSLEDNYDEGEVENVTLDYDDAARQDFRTGRFKLTLAPDAWPDYRATLSVTRADTEYGDTLHDIQFGERTESANVRYDEDYDSDVYSLEQRLLVGEHYDITAITGLIEGDGFRTADFDRTEQPGGFSTFDIVEDRVSQELRLGFDYPGLRGVFGVYYEDSDNALFNNGQDVAVAGGVATLSGFVDSEDEVDTAAAFTEVDWDFLPDWRLTAGLRYNVEEADRRTQSDFVLTLQTLQGLPPQVVGLLPPGTMAPVVLPDPISDQLAAGGLVPPDYNVEDDEKSDVLLPKLGVTWFFADDHNLSLTYQEGFRSGGISVSFFGGEVSVFDPEYTDTLELALRTRWLENSLQANFNVFYTDWQDQQVLIGDPTGFFTTTDNAGESHLYGGEAELLWRFSRHFETFASLGLLKTEFDDFVNDGQDFAGNEFPYAPEYTATVGLALLPWNGWEGQINLQRVDEYYTDPSNTDDRLVAARTLVNAQLGYWLSETLKVFAFGRNLTDDDNIQGRFTDGNRMARRYGEARIVGAGLEWRP